MTTDSPATQLAIPDLPTGSAYLAALPLANPPLAEQRLIAFLDRLLAAPPDPGTLFALLEQARMPLRFVEEEMAKRYHNRPLVLSEQEDEIFRRVVSAWERMEKAYALCARLQPPSDDSPQYATLIATIIHRCIYYMGMSIVEHFGARREIPPGVWHELHGYYATSEQWGVTFIPVSDALENDLQATHCAAAYLTLLLIEIASPYGRSIRDLNLIRRWAVMWSPLVSVHPVDDDYEIPPYIIDLGMDQPIFPAGSAHSIGPDARRLDTSRLGLQISHTLTQLHQRLTPSQLGLGNETSGHVIKLLERISGPWTQSSSPRRFRRFTSEGSADVTTSINAIHFFISGKEFIQPDSSSAYSRSEFDLLYSFRDRAGGSQPMAIAPHGNYHLDEWSVINHSANGFRLARSHAGQRIEHNQLLAIRPDDGENFLLAQVTWLMQEGTGGLVAGLAVLPGRPTACAVRIIEGGENVHTQRFVRAFLLPAVAAINEGDSLVLPSGTYRASGVLMVHEEDKSWQVRMKHVIQRGIDFDRVSFESI
ncbi:MAG: hypothetical protein ACM35F_05850 [Betaproteobacteria bacterium]|jgi:hypothetical protein